MKKHAKATVLTIMLVCFLVTPSALADKSWNIRSPNGSRVTLVITNAALNNIRFYNLDFSRDGSTFSITAAPLRSADTLQTLSVSFFEGEIEAQSEYVDIGQDKTTQEVYCPEEFNRIVIDFFG
jgi:hypothetical protein